MAHKQFLHELLEEDQEPFHLKSYIADRKTQLKNHSPTTTLQLKKRHPVATKRSNLSKHACFLSFHHSPEVRRSPFLGFPSPMKSPCKSPNNAVFLNIPSGTAALLVEAAMRIQKQPKSQSKSVGFGLFGSFLKRLKERSKSKKCAIQSSDFKGSGESTTRLDRKVEKTMKNKKCAVESSDFRISCSCSNRRLSSADWSENNEDKSMDFGASTSSCGSVCSEEVNDDFTSIETRFCSSPFRFSLYRSPSHSGHRTPELCSAASSPSRLAEQDEKNYESRQSDNVEEAEEKEQCSPVSVLDPPFDEDDERESGDAQEDDYHLQCSYENVQRAKQLLLHRLCRFEKLAELDPIELERKLLEGSDDEHDIEREESDDDEPLSLHKKQSVETFVTQVFNQSTDMKRLVSDLIVEEKGETVRLGSNDVIMGRICNRFDSWKEVEFDTIDMMVESDLKRGFDGWTRFDEQVEETAADIALEVYVVLVDELFDETEKFCC